MSHLPLWPKSEAEIATLRNLHVRIWEVQFVVKISAYVLLYFPFFIIYFK